MDQIGQEQFKNQLENLRVEVGKRVESIPEPERHEEIHKEAIHGVIAEKLGKDTSAKGGTGDTTTTLDPSTTAAVDQLVSEAVSKDLEGAIKKAKDSNDPLIIDTFHDAIVDELYERLVSEGKLKSVTK